MESGQLVKEPTKTGRGIWRGTVQKQVNCVGADVMFEFWKGKQKEDIHLGKGGGIHLSKQGSCKLSTPVELAYVHFKCCSNL